MLLFYDIIAKASFSPVDRLGVERKRQPLLDVLPRLVKARRAQCGVFAIFSTCSDVATNSSPVSAASAPASVT